MSLINKRPASGQAGVSLQLARERDSRRQ